MYWWVDFDNGIPGLNGKRILNTYIGDGESLMVFVTEDGVVVLEAIGDCCSTSWFADVFGGEALKGGLVTGTEEVTLDDYNLNDGRCREEVDALYGFKIKTDKGVATIAFRNSSNGYYGGWLEIASEDTRKNVIESLAAHPSHWTEITEDWSA